MGEHREGCTAGFVGEGQTEYHEGPERCDACDALLRVVLRHEGVVLPESVEDRNRRIEYGVLDGLYRSHRESN